MITLTESERLRARVVGAQGGGPRDVSAHEQIAMLRAERDFARAVLDEVWAMAYHVYYKAERRASEKLRARGAL